MSVDILGFGQEKVLTEREILSISIITFHCWAHSWCADTSVFVLTVYRRMRWGLVLIVLSKTFCVGPC